MRYSRKTQKTDIVNAKDLQSSQGFYRSLPETEIVHHEPGMFIQLEISGHVLRVIQVRESQGRRREPIKVRITIDSIAQLTNSLRSKNIAYELHCQLSSDPVVEVIDPDDNRIVFTELPHVVNGESL